LNDKFRYCLIFNALGYPHLGVVEVPVFVQYSGHGLTFGLEVWSAAKLIAYWKTQFFPVATLYSYLASANISASGRVYYVYISDSFIYVCQICFRIKRMCKNWRSINVISKKKT